MYFVFVWHRRSEGEILILPLPNKGNIRIFEPDGVRWFQILMLEGETQWKVWVWWGKEGNKRVSSLDIHLFIHSTFIEYVLYAQH